MWLYIEHLTMLYLYLYLYLDLDVAYDTTNAAIYPRDTVKQKRYI
jgi:hypothetical protein